MKCWEVLEIFNESGQAKGKIEMACDDWRWSARVFT